jgi:hypothetical protein
MQTREQPAPGDDRAVVPSQPQLEPLQQEIGGRAGPEPTRFGDWEKNGRCIDF